MVVQKKIKDFNYLDDFPNLNDVLVPAAETLPTGSRNTKVIISEGKIVERVYETPNGESISIF
tara:strand:+ start:186 stop:374 length:189 start_codon:yes stop_codon:yes gene_type:complete